MGHSLPDKEEARLAALRQYRILDTPRESDFDDIVKLAAQICQTPVSLVSLVDRDRQWFKGRYGLELSETPRRLSFCSHTIQRAPEMMEVPDATQDARFADNELVTGPHQMHYYAGAPLVTPEGYALGTLCVIDRKPRQLTREQKEALGILSRQVLTQLELRRRVAELACTSAALMAANKELEGFSHAISHDLRAPLRTATSFAQILLRRHGGEFSPETAAILQQITHSTESMAHILDDFLRLLRLKKQPLSQAEVDMNRLVQEVIRDLEAANPGAAARFEVGPLPAIRGDQGLLRQVWVNLLSNALKFSRHRHPPVIEIGTREEPGRVVYFVRDNGVGFDTKEAEHLWTAFRRLHGKEFEGTGLGLSIVQGIVERHGGEVWAEGAPDQGATFYFRFPNRVESAPLNQAA